MKRQPTETQVLAMEEAARLNREYFNQLGHEVSKPIIDDLKSKFVRKSLVKLGTDGKVDPVQMAVAAGAYEVISYIEQRIKLGETGT